MITETNKRNWINPTLSALSIIFGAISFLPIPGLSSIKGIGYLSFFGIAAAITCFFRKPGPYSRGFAIIGLAISLLLPVVFLIYYCCVPIVHIHD